MDFEAFVLNPATLLVIVFGLVEFVKQFGAKGNGLRLLSLGLGVSMAVAFKVRELVPEWGVPVHIRSDNSSEFIVKKVRKFLSRLSVKPPLIEPGSPWENGYIESFNGKMRDELLAREIFYSLKEAQVLIKMWRKHDNTIRPHSSLGYRPSAPETIIGQPSQVPQFSLSL